jgi:hypothetical protein
MVQILSIVTIVTPPWRRLLRSRSSSIVVICFNFEAPGLRGDHDYAAAGQLPGKTVLTPEP